MADAALADMRNERADIDARFAAEEQTCHRRFFATSCTDEARERRRLALMQLRSVEIEANAFKRQARVVERDRALADKQAREPADSQEPGGQQEGEKAEEENPANSAQDQQSPEAARNVKTTIFSRSARHDAKLKQVQAEEAADADKRAKNLAAYERKVKAALARQSSVERKKAEKERKRRTKQASVPSPQKIQPDN